MTGFNNPSPSHYQPKANLNENVKSEFKFMGATAFTKSTQSFMDVNWNPKEKEKMPGPNHYQRFSDFSGISK